MNPNQATSNPTQSQSIFDKKIPLTDELLLKKQEGLMGFQRRFDRISRQMQLLMHLNELQKWSNKHHQTSLPICDYVSEQYPLIVFHGDVGTGKTVTAECLANRLVLSDPQGVDSTLFKLSTRVRGSGKVGEMGTLLNEAFQQVIASAGRNRRAFLIIDEGDSLAAKRSQEHSHHEDKVAVNTLIQNIDDLRPFKGRTLVILCTNRLSVVDPGILRRAAVIEEFKRPDEQERLQLFEHDLRGLKLSSTEIHQLVRATGPNAQSQAGWTYSDIRTRLYPAALAQAYPDHPLSFKILLQVASEMRASSVVEDL